MKRRFSRPLRRIAASVACWTMGWTVACSRPPSPAPGLDPAPRSASSASIEGEPGLSGVAVVELFTSEGCSSCPKADALLAELVADNDARRRNVLFLAFHVDYWDELGYPDPWSSRAYTARQRSYARQFHSQGMYTPQAVISGTVEVLGSDGSAVRSAIDAALARPASATLSVETSDAGAAIDVSYEVHGNFDESVIHAALIERGLVDVPSAGENQGATLRHEDVVRAFETVRAEKVGTVRLTVPTSVHRDHAAVVVYLQRRFDLAIVGGTLAVLQL